MHRRANAGTNVSVAMPAAAMMSTQGNALAGKSLAGSSSRRPNARLSTKANAVVAAVDPLLVRTARGESNANSDPFALYAACLCTPLSRPVGATDACGRSQAWSAPLCG